MHSSLALPLLSGAEGAPNSRPKIQSSEERISGLVYMTIEPNLSLMPTHAELAARLLRDAAEFFRTVAQQNASIREQMRENASVFEEVATLVETDPTGTVEE